MSLSKPQQESVVELREITSLLGLDYELISNYESSDRLPHLSAIKHTIVRGQIVLWYALVDEYLNLRMVYAFFSKKRSTIALWRTKRFQLFNYHVLEELALMQKLRFVKATEKLPRGIAADIERLNALRNGVAHALFPENLKKSSPMWKGRDVFTTVGLRALSDDVHKITQYFLGEDGPNQPKER
jgi:hypothetical protein